MRTDSGRIVEARVSAHLLELRAKTAFDGIDDVPRVPPSWRLFALTFGKYNWVTDAGNLQRMAHWLSLLIAKCRYGEIGTINNAPSVRKAELDPTAAAIYNLANSSA
ncbi:hypothetical protein GCM10025762_48600 [Haloechinothrix salitolerans]